MITQPCTYYVNVYSDGLTGAPHASRERADMTIATPARHVRRIGIWRIRMKEVR